MVFCTKCGKENQKESIYCYNCGANLTQTNLIGEINTATTDGRNKNFNYQNTEKQLAKRDKSSKGSKHPVISILDAITNISVYLFILVPIGIVIMVIFNYFTGKQLFDSIVDTMVISLLLFVALIYVSSVISDRLKSNLKQKIIKTGVPAQARIIEVNNLEYNHVDGIRTAKLILKVYPKTNTPYHAKSTVKVGVSDASLVFRPGTTIQVFIDPEDASQVEVEY